MELQGDEAYYWLYSKYLAWGYYDHPPMVAAFIWIGDHIMHNELGLRLLNGYRQLGFRYTSFGSSLKSMPSAQGHSY